MEFIFKCPPSLKGQPIYRWATVTKAKKAKEKKTVNEAQPDLSYDRKVEQSFIEFERLFRELRFVWTSEAFAS